jgi:GxxExxY protein
MIGSGTHRSLLHQEIAEVAIGALCAVYNELGSGFLESVYRRAMCFEFESRDIACREEVPVPVRFRDRVAGEYRADLLLSDRVIIESKTCSSLTQGHEAQLLHYLKATGLTVGLILNFGPRASFKRLVRSAAHS